MVVFMGSLPHELNEEKTYQISHFHEIHVESSRMEGLGRGYVGYI